MSIVNFPFSGTSPGNAGPYSAELFRLYIETLFTGLNRANAGVLLLSGDGVDEPLTVQQTSPASAQVVITPGAALVNGGWFYSDSDETLTIAANTDPSGFARIDLVILRLNATAQTITIVDLQGTPAGSPVAPTLTQTATQYEIPLAQIAVANLFTTIVTANINNTVRSFARELQRDEGGIAPFDYADDELLMGVGASSGKPVKAKFDWAEFNSNYATAAARPTIAVTANTWATVPLATEVGDADGNFSIASNQVNIVNAGRYLFFGGSFFYQISTVVGVFELRLRNVTQGVDLCKGIGFNGTAGNVLATIESAWFEANASDKLELQINHTQTATITMGVNQNAWSGTNPKAVALSFLKVRPLT